MKYDPAIHSPIFGPDEKPVNVGWYASSCIDEMGEADIGDSIFDEFWWYWNGDEWMVSDSNYSALAINQSRYWFGLREKPEE